MKKNRVWHVGRYPMPGYPGALRGASEDGQRVRATLVIADPPLDTWRYIQRFCGSSDFACPGGLRTEAQQGDDHPIPHLVSMHANRGQAQPMDG